MPDVNQKIRQRIQKLLAVARDPAAAPGEARNALAFAARLMREHHLQEEDLTSSTSEHDGYPAVQVQSLSLRHCLWEQVLATSCARAAGGVYVMGYGEAVETATERRSFTERGYRFFGTAAAINVAAELFISLRDAIASSCVYGGLLRGPGREYAEGFVLGLSSGLDELEALPAPVEKGLVLRVEAIERWAHGRAENLEEGGQFKPRVAGPETYAGYRDGQAHGVKMPQPKLATA